MAKGIHFQSRLSLFRLKIGEEEAKKALLTRFYPLHCFFSKFFSKPEADDQVPDFSFEASEM